MLGEERMIRLLDGIEGAGDIGCDALLDDTPDVFHRIQLRLVLGQEERPNPGMLAQPRRDLVGGVIRSLVPNQQDALLGILREEVVQERQRGRGVGLGGQPILPLARDQIQRAIAVDVVVLLGGGDADLVALPHPHAAQRRESAELGFVLDQAYRADRRRLQGA